MKLLLISLLLLAVFVVGSEGHWQYRRCIKKVENLQSHLDCSKARLKDCVDRYGPTTPALTTPPQTTPPATTPPAMTPPATTPSPTPSLPECETVQNYKCGTIVDCIVNGGSFVDNYHCPLGNLCCQVN